MTVIAFGFGALVLPAPASDSSALHAPRPGMQLLLSRLRRQGHELVLATCGPESQARRMAHHLDLLLLFGTIRGARSGSEIAWEVLLEDLGREGVLPPGSLFIGGRPEECRAAHMAGLRVVGLGCDPAGRAEAVLDSVAALEAWLAILVGSPEKLDPFNRSE